MIKKLGIALFLLLGFSVMAVVEIRRRQAVSVRTQALNRELEAQVAERTEALESDREQ